ncbi:hypothetical protein EES44_24710 [Streptomyces sp. ADI96-15]|uniref:hypothetical protein n=1 Tax=Streptomyces TaxID=1883 RepID=UPI000F550B28|nr:MULTISPECIES: hypothetical protein [Streptomyces]MDH6189211.1 hypothetical protein [Streptomyces sp. CZ24]RPK57933.1 hypothetical protein EES44_24710 [Streptomyces sp. ADI96-15]
MTHHRRTYCRCTTVQNYDYDEAASKLRCFRRWLENNISRIPHQKIGGAVAFCDCELSLIQAMSTVLPAGVLTEDEPEPTPPDSMTLRTIRPSGGRRRSHAVS